jgi:hypothetical protein
MIVPLLARNCSLSLGGGECEHPLRLRNRALRFPEFHTWNQFARPSVHPNASYLVSYLATARSQASLLLCRRAGERPAHLLLAPADHFGNHASEAANERKDAGTVRTLPRHRNKCRNRVQGVRRQGASRGDRRQGRSTFKTTREIQRLARETSQTQISRAGLSPVGPRGSSEEPLRRPSMDRVTFEPRQRKISAGSPNSCPCRSA